MPAPIAFLDTETDGVHPGRKPWEVAIVRREPDGSETEWQAYIEIDLSTADPFGLRVGRFYDRHPLGLWLSGQVEEWPEPAESGSYLTRQAAARLVARWTHGAHIVGAVPNFDTETLAPALRTEQLILASHYHLIDIESLAVGYVAGDGNVSRLDISPPWRSDDLGELLGVKPATDEERHTAMGDVRWVMRMYDRIMGGVA